VTTSSAAGHPSNDDRISLSVRSAHELISARATVADHAAMAGIDAERSGRMALAVSEVATNALVHAASSAHLEIITTDDWFLVEVSDHGPGLPFSLRRDRPAPNEERGRGLWLVEQLCDRVEVAAKPDGGHISLYLRR
jgi:anti-sigma regulatory factor (Ser/Thr protein kinase)